jgi:hypothetical protein
MQTESIPCANILRWGRKILKDLKTVFSPSIKPLKLPVHNKIDV